MSRYQFGDDASTHNDVFIPATATVTDVTLSCDSCGTEITFRPDQCASHDCGDASEPWRIEPTPSEFCPPNVQRRRLARMKVRAARYRVASWIAGYDITDY